MERADKARGRDTCHDPEPGQRDWRASQPGRFPAQPAGRPQRLSRRAGGIFQLACRAVGLGPHRSALQPVLPHGGPGRARARRVQDAGIPRHQQLQELPARSRQAVRAGHARWLCHRRRDPVLPGRERIQPGWPRPHDRVGGIPCRHRQLERDGGARRALGDAQRWQAQQLSLPDPGPQRDEDHRKDHWQDPARTQVLPHDPHDHRRQGRARAAPWHGRAAGL